MTRTVYAIFDDSTKVRDAIAAVQSRGIEPENITISARDPETAQVVGATGDETASGLAGAGVGAAAGGIAGAALSIVPAVIAAPIALPIFVLFGGAVVGALAGTVGGAILGTGHQLQQMEAVERSLEDGKILMAVKTPGDRAEEMQSALEQAGGSLPQPAGD